jgi:hypothetical protein
MTNFLYEPKHRSFGRDLTFSLHFHFEGSVVRTRQMRVAFWNKKPSTFCFAFSGQAAEYWIGNCDFDFVMLSFSFLPPNGAQFNFEFYWVVHFVTDNCSEQAVHSVPCFPRTLYTDVQRFGSRSARLNAEVCYRREGAEATSRGKMPVCILLFVEFCVRCCCCNSVTF